VTVYKAGLIKIRYFLTKVYNNFSFNVNFVILNYFNQFSYFFNFFFFAKYFFFFDIVRSLVSN